MQRCTMVRFPNKIRTAHDLSTHRFYRALCRPLNIRVTHRESPFQFTNKRARILRVIVALVSPFWQAGAWTGGHVGWRLRGLHACELSEKPLWRPIVGGSKVDLHQLAFLRMSLN
jgi:hypothetical protein